MPKISFIFVLVLFSKTVLSCQENKQSISINLQDSRTNKVDSVKVNFDDTIKSVFSSVDKKLPYTLLNYSDSLSAERSVFIVFLHGSGERGSDNQAQLNVGLPTFVKSLRLSGLKNFVVFAPQCPVNELWVDADWKANSHKMKKDPTSSMSSTFYVMDSLISVLPNIDTSRIYVTGLSMGGFGVWDMLQRRPDFFAAAIPVCGGGDNSCGKLLSKTPVWAFHGSKDKAVPVFRTTDMFQAIKKETDSTSLKMKMTIYQNKGHLIWNDVYEDSQVINWLLRQKRF